MERQRLAEQWDSYARVVRRLQYPRDKDQILAELAKWPEFAWSILREEK